MNIINLLGILYKEDIISNFLVGLIKESENFKTSFLENIVGIKNIGLYNVEAFTRIATSQGIPDIVIKMSSEKENVLVIIENKLKAEEGYQQTARYLKEECIKDLCNNSKIGLNYKSVRKEFIYLTLLPEQIPTGDKFINKTYKDLLADVNIEVEDEFLNKIYKDFLDLMGRFYKGLDVKEDDKLLALFDDAMDNEKIYIRFKRLIKKADFEHALEIKWIGKTGGTGRVGFAAKIGKDTWLSQDQVKTVDGKYMFSDKIYDIHLEFCFDVFSKSIKLPLHYETNPYVPKSKWSKNSEAEEYTKYVVTRNKFKDRLHKKINNLGVTDIKNYNGSNQIAIVKLSVEEDETVKDFLKKLKTYCSRISLLVDETLAELNL